MSREDRQAYLAYCKTAPFLSPVPRAIVRIVGTPLRVVSRRGSTVNKRNLACAFGVYLLLAIILSAPFALLKWPGQDWSTWPSGRPPGTGSPPKDSTPESSEPPNPGREVQTPEIIPGVYECLPLGTGSLNVGVCR